MIETRPSTIGSKAETSPGLAKSRLARMCDGIRDAVKGCWQHKVETTFVGGGLIAAALFVALRDKPPGPAHDEFDGMGRMVAEHGDSAYWKAWSLRKDGKVQEAIDVLESAEPTEKNAIFKYQLYKEIGDRVRQIDTLRGVLAMSPNSTHVSRLLARVYEENGEVDEAIRVLEEAVPHVKGNTTQHQNLVLKIVEWLESQGRSEEALERLRVAGPDLNYWYEEKLRAAEHKRK